MRPSRSTQIRELEPDLLVTAAYGQILSPALLSIPRLGGINLHGSILPAYRGAAPVARAIQNGETESGVTVIRMTPKIDAGGIISIARTADRTRRNGRRAGRTSGPARCSAHCRSHRRTRRGKRDDLAPGSIESHQSPQASQGRRSDRLGKAGAGRS